MQWEVEDFRKKDPNDPGPWLTWIVPKELVFTYVTRLLFWTIIIPYLLFGAILAPLGFAIQMLVIDYFTWLQIKNKLT
tara:strand:- start:4277 stop:4510 length:234 start_codon:yes stop_codon:yes gene_type:complete